jgi:CBS domain containing-hemolysin-like protein
MCSLFEAVLYSVPLSHIESMEQSGSPFGRVLRRLRENVDEPIAAILTLNTVSHTAGAAMTGAIAVEVFGSYWIGVFSIVFTFIILVFSEIVPKTLGVVHSRSLSVLIAFPLQFLVWLLTPALWFTSFITRLVAPSEAPEHISEDDLIGLARRGIREGVIEEDEGLVIQNILSLGDKQVSDVMTPRTVVFALEGELTVEEAWKDKGLLPHSRIPIYDGTLDEIVGILHRHALFAAAAEDRMAVRLEELMKPVHFILETTPLDKTLEMFLEKKQHIFVVVGEFGGVSGVITLEDVLEEILGREIVDEFDRVTDMRELAQRRREKVIKGEDNSG